MGVYKFMTNPIAMANGIFVLIISIVVFCELCFMVHFHHSLTGDRTGSGSNLRETSSIILRDEISQALHVNAPAIIRTSKLHARYLMERAARNRSQAIYGSLETPLLGFLVPKTGSNSQEYYLLSALAAVGEIAYAGCEGQDMYTCMLAPENINKTLCSVGFSNHFHPKNLLDTLIEAQKIQQDPGSKIATEPCQRFPPDIMNKAASGDNTQVYANILRNHSVCMMVLRDPVERTISGFYEWYYQKSTNLTAMEFLRKHGAERFSKLVEIQANWATAGGIRRGVEAVFGSCLIGVTENMDEFVTVLSRILRVAPPQSGAVKARSRDRTGVKEVDYPIFYRALSPFLRQEIALWDLAAEISRAQYSIAMNYNRLLKVEDSPNPEKRRIKGDCPGCQICTPPGLERCRWTSYQAKYGCVGPAIYQNVTRCCTHRE